MNRIGLMHKIKVYLSRFETYVRISNLSDEFDINRYSEDFIIPLLNLVFGWELENLNRLDKKNAKSLDLIDRKRKIGVQVTSDISIQKVKSTITKFVSSEYKNKVNKVLFYFLKPKQKTYSIDSIARVTKRKLKFSVASNIIDNSVLYEKIKGIVDEDRINQIHELLRKEFSDFNYKGNFSVKDYESFKEKYKESCINNFSRLNFFGLSIPKKPREIELYELFVQPSFSTKFDEILEKNIQVSLFQSVRDINLRLSNQIVHSESTYSPNNVDFKYLFSIAPHIVILGNPGAGKSSLVKYSICKIVEEDKNVFLHDDIYYYLPIRLELHKYNRFKKEGKGGILEYLTFNLKEEFQLSIEKEKIEYYLNNFPILVFFDGLDEIFDVHERINVRNDIENFTKNNKISRTVVTSRYESFEEVQLNTALYKVIDVLDFNKGQIKEYVSRWYNIEETNEYVKVQEVKNCITQLKDVDNELKRNPLLLSLILILYRNEQDLPTSKLEIYEGCAQTLVDTRDKKEKKLDIQLSISNKISVFSNIAYWQFSNEIEKANIKIDYPTVRKYIADHLVRKGEFEDFEAADEAAKEFLDYAKLRSIYLENKFTHKTFYEYFTAYYIYINFYTKGGGWEKLQKLIVSNIGVASWHVILELLICKIDQNQIDFEIIDSILKNLLKEKSEETSYFFSGILKHIRNISPLMTRTIISRMCYFLTDSNYLKRTDSLVLKNYFENLVYLFKIRKYKEAFVKSFDSKFSESIKVSYEIFNFLHELFIVTKEKDIKSLLDECKIDFEAPDSKERAFMLNNFVELNDKSKSTKLFESYYHTFGIAGLRKTFQSTYGQNIFGSRIKFNWLSHLVNDCTSIADISSLENRLNTMGIQMKDVKDILKNNVQLLTSKPYEFIIVRAHSMQKSRPEGALITILYEIYRTYGIVIEPTEKVFYLLDRGGNKAIRVDEYEERS